jgi:cardiolipin synthase A/B
MTRAALAVVLATTALACGAGAPRPNGGPFHLRVDVPPAGEEFRVALYQSVAAELRPGHTVSFAGNGDVFAAIANDIRNAKVSVHVDVFIWQKGKASDGLLAAIAERAKGVECRVVVDDAGSPGFEEDIAPKLKAAGCEARIFRKGRLPPEGGIFVRNHRKIVVIDGRVGFTGGFGIRDEWLGDGVTAEGWRDENVRFTGPAVAAAQQAIAENWQEAGGALFPPSAFPSLDAPETAGISAAFVTSTASPIVTRADRLQQLLFSAAKKRLWIANPYFVPSDAITDILKAKAKAGVDVRLLVPGKKTDSKVSLVSQKVEYGSLVDAGVRPFEYQPSMMHAKTILVDDEIAVVGSMNLEPISMQRLEEDALVVQDRAFNEEMARRFEHDCTLSRAVAK